jgi:WD40 repeat protein
MAERQVDIAHETLITGWPLLEQWIRDSQVDERERRRWADRTHEWVTLGMGTDRLLDEVELAAARRWQARPYASENLIRDFDALVTQSHEQIEAEKLHEQQQQQELARRNRRLAIASVILLLAVVGLAYLGWQTSLAREKASEALSRQLASRVIDQILPDSQVDLAALLSREALARHESVEARASLLASLTATRQRYAIRLREVTQGGNLQTVAFGGSGELLTVGSSSGGLRLWRRSGEDWIPQAAPTGHDGTVSALAFDPSGSVLASGGSDATIRLWDTAAAAPLSPPVATGESEIRALGFDPVSQLLAWASADGWLRTWDRQTGQLGSRFCGADGSVRLEEAPGPAVCVGEAGRVEPMGEVAFSGNGRIIAGSSDSGRVSIWRGVAAGWEYESRTFTEGGPVTGLALSSREPLLAIASKDRVDLWDLNIGSTTLLPVPIRAQVPSVAFSMDGSLLAVGGEGSIVIYARTESGWSPRDQLDGHQSASVALAFSPNSPKLLASAAADDNVILWDISTDPMLATVPPAHLGPANVFAFNRDATAIGASTQDGEIGLWVWRDGDWLEALPPFRAHDDAITGLAFSPRDQLLATAAADGSVRFWDVEARQEIASSPSPAQERLRSVAFSDDGAMLATGGTNGMIVLWRRVGGVWSPVDQQWTGYDEEITSLDFSPDGALLVSGDKAGNVLEWTPTPLRKGLAHRGPRHNLEVTAIAFRDNRSFLWARTDARIVEATTGESTSGQEPPSLGSGAIRFALDPERQLIAVGTKTGEIRIVDLQSLSDVGPLGAFGNRPILSLAFSADGKSLFSIDFDGKVIRWDSNLESWKSRACAIAGRPLAPLEIQAYLSPEEPTASCPDRSAKS